MMQSFIESATESLDSLDDKEEITFSNLSLKLATDVIGKAAFGVDFGLSRAKSDAAAVKQDTVKTRSEDEVSDFINQHIYSTTQLKMDLSGSFSIILGLLVPFLQEPFRQILKRIPGTMDRKVDQTNRKLSGRLNEIVAKRIEDRKSWDGSKDFLSLILRAREDSSDKISENVFTPDYISAVTYEHLLAGSATTSFTLSSVVYLVSGHPEVEKKLLEEIDRFGPRDLMPTASDLQTKFPYLDQARHSIRTFNLQIFPEFPVLPLLLRIDLQVVKEAMRFYTVSPLVARETSRQIEIGGYVLPKVLIIP